MRVAPAPHGRRACPAPGSSGAPGTLVAISASRRHASRSGSSIPSCQWLARMPRQQRGRASGHQREQLGQRMLRGQRCRAGCGRRRAARPLLRADELEAAGPSALAKPPSRGHGGTVANAERRPARRGCPSATAAFAAGVAPRVRRVSISCDRVQTSRSIERRRRGHSVAHAVAPARRRITASAGSRHR